LQKKTIVANSIISNFRAYDLSNDVSFVIFGHQTWDLDPPPPPSVYWFLSTPAGIGLSDG